MILSIQTIICLIILYGFSIIGTAYYITKLYNSISDDTKQWKFMRDCEELFKNVLIFLALIISFPIILLLF